jgi:hypothetical protein
MHGTFGRGGPASGRGERRHGQTETASPPSRCGPRSRGRHAVERRRVRSKAGPWGTSSPTDARITDAVPGRRTQPSSAPRSLARRLTKLARSNFRRAQRLRRAIAVRQRQVPELPGHWRAAWRGGADMQWLSTRPS